jgi:hypothetical protein
LARDSRTIIAGKMSNDEILMTNECPNDPMTKAWPALAWPFRASTFVILWSFFLGMAAANQYLSLTYGL